MRTYPELATAILGEWSVGVVGWRTRGVCRLWQRVLGEVIVDMDVEDIPQVLDVLHLED